MDNLKMKPFIIEVWENGKVSLPAFVTMPEQQLTIDELKKCRAYLDLIISNPDNFHVVINRVHDTMMPKCKVCKNILIGVVEVPNGICFECEKKAILKSSDTFNPISCLVCEGEFDNPMQAQLGICGKCIKTRDKQIKKTNDII